MGTPGSEGPSRELLAKYEHAAVKLRENVAERTSGGGQGDGMEMMQDQVNHMQDQTTSVVREECEEAVRHIAVWLQSPEVMANPSVAQECQRIDSALRASLNSMLSLRASEHARQQQTAPHA